MLKSNELDVFGGLRGLIIYGALRCLQTVRPRYENAVISDMCVRVRKVLQQLTVFDKTTLIRVCDKSDSVRVATPLNEGKKKNTDIPIKDNFICNGNATQGTQSKRSK